MDGKIKINDDLLSRSRKAAVRIADKIVNLIEDKTTDSVERSVARLMGIDGVDSQGVPLPNVVVDQIKKSGKVEDGVFYWMGNAMIETGKTPQEIALAIGKGDFLITDFPEYTAEEIWGAAESVVLLHLVISTFPSSPRIRRFEATFSTFASPNPRCVTG